LSTTFPSVAGNAAPQRLHLAFAALASIGDRSAITILYFVPQAGQLNGIGSDALMRLTKRSAVAATMRDPAKKL
jgi:hypothetical protein